MKILKSQPNSKSKEIEISQEYIKHILEKICFPRPIGEYANEIVCMFLTHEFVEMGFETKTTSSFNNIVAGNPKKSKILIGAHYDSVPGTSGADDNGSAVAVMMAVARIIGPESGVCFVAFNGEEKNLAGSRDFVENLGHNEIEQVHILEMVGYTNKSQNSQKNPLPLIQDIPTIGDFLGLVGTTEAHHSLSQVIDAAGSVGTPFVGLTLPDLTWDIIQDEAPHVFRSDHAPFWIAKIPALMWTDTAEFRNPNYHKNTDTIETLDFEFMCDVATVLATIAKKG